VGDRADPVAGFAFAGSATQRIDDFAWRCSRTQVGIVGDLVAVGIRKIGFRRRLGRATGNGDCDTEFRSEA
jgi:hypothetical protein